MVIQGDYSYSYPSIHHLLSEKEATVWLERSKEL